MSQPPYPITGTAWAARGSPTLSPSVGTTTIWVVADSVEAIAYEQAVRAVDGQSATLESLRGRAATMISAASLVTAFLGGLALAGPTVTNGQIVRTPLSGWSWVAVGAFVA